jgi:hypothetical protein
MKLVFAMATVTNTQIDKKVAFNSIVAITEDEMESNRNESSDCTQRSSRCRRIVFIVFIIIMMVGCYFGLMWLNLEVAATELPSITIAPYRPG